jgi:hypothetical protein
MRYTMSNMNRALLLSAAMTMMSGCVSTIIGATTDAAIEVVKIPFKIGGAAVDMMRGEDPDNVGHKKSEKEVEEEEKPTVEKT